MKTYCPFFYPTQIIVLGVCSFCTSCFKRIRVCNCSNKQIPFDTFISALEVLGLYFLCCQASQGRKYSRQDGGTQTDGESKRRSDVREEGGCRILEGKLQFTLKTRHPANTETLQTVHFTDWLRQDLAGQRWRWSAIGYLSWQWLTRAKRNMDNASDIHTKNLLQRFGCVLRKTCLLCLFSEF